MDGQARDLESVLTAMRPTLHRYCARMTGSAVDGEDAVQETMLKALTAAPAAGPLDNPEGWLFRIAHRAALDVLRRRRRAPEPLDEAALAVAAAPDAPDPGIAAASLRTFLRLPALQRSAVILRDVLGHSLHEVASITGATEAAAKSALQRGRARLRAMAGAADDAPPPLPAAARAQLLAYVERFRAGDFDAVRAMLADDVRLDLVGRLQRRGKGEVGEYYGRYADAADRWVYGAATVDGWPAMLVYDRAVSLDVPAHFVALAFAGGRIAAISDFLAARYAMEGCTVLALDAAPARI